MNLNNSSGGVWHSDLSILQCHLPVGPVSNALWVMKQLSLPRAERTPVLLHRLCIFPSPSIRTPIEFLM